MKKQISFLLFLLILPTLVLGQNESLDEAFSNPTNLTDTEMNNAKEFVHQGVKDRVINEGCKDLKDCKPIEDGFPIEMMLGKAYGLMGILTSGGGIVPTLTKKTPKVTETAPAAEAEAPKGKVKKETQPDYCGIIAMAYETIGGMIQQSLQQKADNSVSGIGDAQLQALVSLKEAHKARAKTASFQRAIYAGVTTCYAAMLATGQIVPDWKYMVKLGGATALTSLYWIKVSKHKKASKKVQLVIDSLPKAGKGCDPWTKTSCFCKEATSKAVYPAEYQEVCILNNGDFDTPKMAMGCAAMSGKSLQFDKECKCKQTNSCFKSNLKVFNPKLTLATNLMNDANKTFDLLNSGEFDEAKLDQASLNAGVMAARMKINATEPLPKTSLNEEQAKMAEALQPHMPAAMANLAAASNGSYGGGISDSMPKSSALGSLPASVKAELAESISVNYRSGGESTSFASEEPDFTMPSFPGQGSQEVKGNTEILTFTEQAISKADVSNRPDTPIFDIISNRYRRSGWQKLDRFEK